MYFRVCVCVCVYVYVITENLNISDLILLNVKNELIIGLKKEL